ncbi:MAG TPA: hypothetical protein VHT27_12345 [Solirubrobacteraceae bacterium]|jgi:hypothetical protein|nr:hypothetical protein [Solirubrobacteraceae bacterium]
MTARRRLQLALAAGVAALALICVLRGLGGGAAGLAYLGPAIFVLLPLSLGRYPGERTLIALALERQPRERLTPLPGAPSWLAISSMPRGARLMAWALAGRAPPLAVGLIQPTSGSRRASLAVIA